MAANLMAYWGNVVAIDAVLGHDNIGARNGYPFQTVAAALAVAVAGDVVLIRPGTYVLAAPITLPAGVAVVGLEHHLTILSYVAAAPTTLVTMALDSTLQSLTVRLTSAGHHALTAVEFPGITAESAHLLDCNVEVDNSGAGAGASDVIGVHFSGTGTGTIRNTPMDSVRVSVLSVGTGKKRGILVDTGAQTVPLVSCFVGSIGGADSIGLEVNHAGASVRTFDGQYSGDTADVSQTAGTLSLDATDLEHNNANAKGVDAVRKNGVDTALTVTLTGAATTATILSTSVAFAVGDDLSVSINDSGATADVVAVIGFY